MAQSKATETSRRYVRKGVQVMSSARRILFQILQWSHQLSLRRTMRVCHRGFSAFWMLLQECCCKLLEQSTKQKDWRIAWVMVDRLTNTSFEMSISRRYIRNLADCDAVTMTVTREIVKDDGFREIFIRGTMGKWDGCCTLYVKNVNEKLRKQLEFRGKDEITISPELEITSLRATSASITT